MAHRRIAFGPAHHVGVLRDRRQPHGATRPHALASDTHAVEEANVRPQTDVLLHAREGGAIELREQSCRKHSHTSGHKLLQTRQVGEKLDLVDEHMAASEHGRQLCPQCV